MKSSWKVNPFSGFVAERNIKNAFWCLAFNFRQVCSTTFLIEKILILENIIPLNICKRHGNLDVLKMVFECVKSSWH